MMRVMNPTKCAVTLSPNTVVANVSYVETQEVHPLYDENDATIYSCQNSANSDDRVPNNDKFDFDVNHPNLSNEQKEKLNTFLNQNSDVFSDSLQTIGKTDLFKHKIETIPDTKPVRQRFYRQDPVKKAVIEEKTNELLETGIAQRSTSVWNSPVVLVKKKDDSWRFAIDYRKLNQVTIPISQPLPRTEDVFDALGETHATIFSTLDLNSAYFQIPLDPETRQKSAFVTHEGVFEFTRMPFGLRNAPMSFQLLMSLVLKGLNWKFVLCYIDDILVFSPDFNTHLHHLTEVFQRLRDAKLTLKPSKCKFGVEKVVFLGHVISSEGVAVESSNTDKVRNFPVPQTQRQLRGFLGLCNYYRKFVRNYAKICIPLNALLKNDVRRTFSKTDWTQECQTAFDELKNALLSPPILRYPDMKREFILSTDASGGALGYILGQIDDKGGEYVIAYGGRAIRPDEQKWNTSELECLAIISGIETFKHYLTHQHFTVFTDHSALQWLMTKREPTGRLARWCLKIQSYHFTVKHRKGSQNQNADAISRIDYSQMPESEQHASKIIELPSKSFVALLEDQTNSVTQSSNPVTLDDHSQKQTKYEETVFYYKDVLEVNDEEKEKESDLHDIAHLQRECDDFKDIIKYLEDGIVPEDKNIANCVTVVAENQYVLDNGVLYHIYTPRTKKVKDQNIDNLLLQIALPKCERKSVLAAYHDCQAGGGHFGTKRTFASIKEKYWWPKMYQEIKDYVETCDTCQRTKVLRTGHPVPLSPLPIEDVFSRIHVDILGPLPKTKDGFQYILLVVDSFSKWTECFPLKTQEAKEVADILYREIFTRWGAPRAIVTDRAQNFLSKLVNALCELFDVKRTKTSSYHPQTNATVERANSTVVQILRAYVEKNQQNWPSLLPSIMMAVRSSPCMESTGFSPFRLVFGKEMCLPIDTSLIPKSTLPVNTRQYFEQLLSNFKVTREIAQDRMEKAQEIAKQHHDVRAREPNYKLGDKVLLKCEKPAPGLSIKLHGKSYGPFEIVELGPHFTYRLRTVKPIRLKTVLSMQPGYASITNGSLNLLTIVISQWKFHILMLPQAMVRRTPLMLPQTMVRRISLNTWTTPTERCLIQMLKTLRQGI